MTRLPRLLSIALTCLLCVQTAQAQDADGLAPVDYSDVTMRFVTQADGLRASGAFDLLFDRFGYLWVATNGHLSRYDGYSVSSYAPNQRDSTALNGRPAVLLEDRNGRLLIGTNAGLYAFDRDRDAFARIALADADGSNVSVNALSEDGDGQLWIGTADAGLLQSDPSLGHVASYRHDPEDAESLGGGAIGAILEDRSGRLWVGTNAGLEGMDKSTGAFETLIPGTPGRGTEAQVRCIHEDEDRTDVLWLCTRDGLVEVDVSTGAHVRHLAETRSGLPLSIADLVPDPGEPRVLWLATGTLTRGDAGDGLARFDTRSGEVTWFRHDPLDSGGPPTDDYRSITADRAGMVWASTNRYGLVGVDSSPPRFKLYGHVAGDPASLPDGMSWFLSEDRAGGIWVTNSGNVSGASGDLVRIDRRDGTARTVIKHDPGERTTRAAKHYVDLRGKVWVKKVDGTLDRIDPVSYRVDHFPDVIGVQDASAPLNRFFHQSGFVEDTDGFLWIYRDDGTIARMDPVTGRFTVYRHNPLDPATLSGEPVYSVAKSADRSVWLGTSNGLNRFDPESETFRRYIRLPRDTTAGINNVWGLREGPSGDVWGITFDGVRYALFRFRPEDEQWDVFSHDPERPNATFLLLDGSMRLIERASEPGVVWYRSYGGLTRIDAETGTIRHFSEADGLPDQFIYGMLEDETGRFWLSTNSGITMFDPDTYRVRQFDSSDGLQANEFNAASYLRSKRTGEMFFGGVEGITAFMPGTIQDDPFPPLIDVTAVRAGGHLVVPEGDDGIARRIGAATSLELTHQQNDLTLEFVGLHLRLPKRNRYSHILEGYDDAWSDTTDVRQAVYTNLPPGDYTFRVNAANSDGVWNPDPLRLPISILPPWWRTWWAYALYVLTGLVAVVQLYRWQHERVIRREREITRDRELEQAHEIERQHAELSKAHQTLKTTQTQLIQSEKLASLGQLTAGIAHEIKNPLNFINNFSEVNAELALELQDLVANDSGSARDEIKDLVVSIRTNAQQVSKHGRRADTIVQGMMQHARGGAAERFPVSVNAFVEEYVNLAWHGMRAAHAENRLHIDRDYGDDVGNVTVAAQDMGRVLVNLLNNAFDSVIAEIRSRPIGYSPEVAITTRRSGPRVEIRIADNGPGIPDGLHERIFEPFFTTKPTGAGTGLGLSLAHDIVVQGHGGTLASEDTQGGGATFVVSLPGD